ncbi:FtsX-like permease family protein [bacterium]|nr:FtsX-like permease family protein [bacterium]
MNSFRLARRNVKRDSRRTILTILAISIAVLAVTFMDAYLRGIKESVLDTVIRLESGHIKITSSDAKKHSRGIPLDANIQQVSDVLATVEQSPYIKIATSRIKFPVLMDKPGGSLPAIGNAVQFSKETELLEFEKILIAGNIPQDTSYGVLLGEGLAKSIQKTVGDGLFIVSHDAFGGLGPGLYTVEGIFRSGIGIYDKKFFYVPLAAGQDQLYMPDSALEIICLVKNGLDDSEAANKDVQERLQRSGRGDLDVVPWNQQNTMAAMVGNMGAIYFIMMAILAIIALTTVINTVTMSVMERVKEFGTLRALGYTPWQVMRIVFAESLLLGIVGTIAGFTVGIILALVLQRVGIDLSSGLQGTDLPMKPIIHPHPSILTGVKSIIYGLVVSVIAAVYPARVAVRIRPAEALRST